MTAMLTILVCIAATSSTEITAHRFGIWVYRSRGVLLGHMMSAGLLLGLVSLMMSQQHVAVRFATGAVLGVAHELLNLKALKMWRFPNDRLFVFKSPVGIVLAAGVPWGFIPALAPELARFLSGLF